MNKTPQMELIEERDARLRGGVKRDIRDIISEAYEQTGKLEQAADLIARRYNTTLAFGTLSDWIERFDGSLKRTVVFPEPVAASA
jgi:hypothetical protein